MFIVLEMQTNGENVGVIANSYADRNVAHQKYYTALAAAAVSAIPIHTVVLLTDDGAVEKRDSYNHEVAE